MHTQLNKEKVDLENRLEAEQEYVVNKLCKQVRYSFGCCGHADNQTSQAAQHPLGCGLTVIWDNWCLPSVSAIGKQHGDESQYCVQGLVLLYIDKACGLPCLCSWTNSRVRNQSCTRRRWIWRISWKLSRWEGLLAHPHHAVRLPHDSCTGSGGTSRHNTTGRVLCCLHMDLQDMLHV